MTDPKHIAASLTKAGRSVISNAWPYPDYHRTGEQISYCPVWPHSSTRDALVRRGLISANALGGPRLTPLGQQVRDIIKEQENG